MISPRDITIGQTTAILISTMIGVAILRLPLIAVRAAESGAPFVTFVATIAAFIGLWVITKLGLRFPDESIITYSEVIIGKWVSRLYGIFAIALFIILTGLASREFGTVINTAVLKETPLEVIVIVMLFIAAIVTRHDLNILAYIHFFYVPIIVIPALIIAAVSLNLANPLYLQPIINYEPNGMLIGVLTVVALFQGAFILTLIIPAMKKPEKAMKATIWSIVFTGGLFLIIVMATLAVFGPEEMKKLIWPTLELAREITLPGDILQRLDIVFLAVWVTAVFTTIFSLYMFSVQALSQLFQLRDHKLFSLFLLPIAFVIAMVPQDVMHMYEVIKLVGISGLVITIVFPILLLITAKVRKLPGERGGE